MIDSVMNELTGVCVPGLMRALSVTLNVVTFCFGGTPAFLNISISLSDLCHSGWRKESGKKYVRMKGGKINGETSMSSEQQLDFGIFKINRGPVMTVREPSTHTHRHTRTHLAASVSDIWFHSARSHLSLSSHLKLSFSPLLLTEKISLPKLHTPDKLPLTGE